MRTIVIQTYLYRIGRGVIVPALDEWFRDANKARLFGANALDCLEAYDMYYNDTDLGPPRGQVETILVRRVAGTSDFVSITASDRILGENLVKR
jgi:hypothetical protein